MRYSFAFLAALLAACGEASPTPSASPAPVATSAPVACLTSHPTPDAAVMLTLTGRVTVPPAVADLADVHQGLASGAPVRVVDVLTGGVIAAAVTYYDGSYTVDIPPGIGRRPVLVCCDLVTGSIVDAITGTPLLTLEAPLEMDPALRTQTRDVSAGSTVWVALLASLAGAPGQWERLDVGAVAHKVGGIIAGQDPAAEALAESLATTPAITQATTAEALRAAITASAARFGGR